jgi:hypothetical protein
MKRVFIIAAIMAAACGSALADITVTNAALNIQVVTVSTNTVVVKNAKAIWTGFSIQYFAPDYKRFAVTFSSFWKDLDTGIEIPNTRKTEYIKDVDFAKTLAAMGMDLNALATGITPMMDKYMEFKSKQK